MQGCLNLHKSLNALDHVNEFKVENHMISMAAEMAFGRIQHVFMKKILERIGMEEIYLIIVKTIHDKPTVNTIPNLQKHYAIPSN